MKRSTFLKSVMPAAATVVVPTMAAGSVRCLTTAAPSLVPPYLQPGDTIGITCPAGFISMEEAVACRQLLESWGFRVKLGQTVGRHWQTFGGTDQERAADLQAMIDDPGIRCILSGRGGYGVMRMMDAVRWDNLQRQPKWLVGYSDVTALHSHLNNHLGIASIHADMVNGLPNRVDPSAWTLYEVLTGVTAAYTMGAALENRTGSGEGLLVGGNLSMIVAMMGSAGELQTDGRILFLEDVREYKYTVDRMLMTLKRSGKLSKLAGLVVGGFTRMREDEGDGISLSVAELVLEKVQEYAYPVCFQFPAGHQALNLALKLGMPHRLVVKPDGASLNEARGLPG